MSKLSKIAILGAAESGIGAARLAVREGFDTWVTDLSSIKPPFKKQLQEIKVPFEEGRHSEEKILDASLVVKSPGIPEQAPIVQKIRKEGIELISEIEFAWRYCPGKVIAITGSNGKTTTTLLTHHILKEAGLNASLAGNVGNSFAAEVCHTKRDYYVVEVSSFQLDDISSFRPHIAILTNITPDHLDRYEYNLDRYAQSKMAITRYQEASDFFIYNQDDPESRKALKKNGSSAALLPISIKETLEQGAWLDAQNHIQIKTQKQQQMSIEQLALQGKHNTYNSMASGLAGSLLGIRQERIRECLAGFDSIEHRLEPVLKVYDIQYINDSKATNVNSTSYALETTTGPIIWIAGGVDKGNDYSQLFDLIQGKVKAIICLGEDNTKLHEAFDNKVELVIDAANMDEAVRMSYKMGVKGDSVLLSPACASFDFFENYEDRGRQFKEAVRNL